MKRELSSVLPSLAFYQLQLFIEKGKHVDECKGEWLRRVGVEYPLMKRSL